jgi:WXG100 protein secretion system (Wss), protein YukD
MTVMLVTVAGPSGRHDLMAPADVPVGDLLGPIAAATCRRPGVAGQARWRLALLGGDPLPPDRSLTAGGVGDGAILTLTLDPPATAQPPPVATSAPPASRGSGPPASRRGAGRGWSPVGRGRRSREQEDELLEAAIAAPRLGRCAVVGVVSAADGAGRATVAALLAAALAATRPGLTVAVDARPGPGSLTDRLAPDLDVPVGDLLGLLDHPALTAGELIACLTGSATRPALVAGGRALPLLVRGLARHAGALVLDGGAGLGGPGARAALAAADQLVLVTEPEPSPESRRVAGALADLGHAVVVAAGPVSAGAGGSGSPSASGSGLRSASPAELARLLPGVRGVVPLPHLAAAAPPREWAEVPPWWWRPARQLAYLLAADWPALGMTVR